MYFKTAAICVVVFVALCIFGYVVDWMEKKLDKKFDNTNALLGFILIADFFTFFISLCLGIWNF